MIRRMLFKSAAVTAAFLCALMFMTPVQAQVTGGGPYGDIDGYYTWEVNAKGWTIYSQNGYSWVYEGNGSRTYLDVYGNKLYGASPAAAKTITDMRLMYHSTVNGVMVYKGPDGNLYTVDNNGGVYSHGSAPAPAPAPAPAAGGRDLVVRYAFNSADGYVVYQDGNGKYWFFGEGYYPTHYWGNSIGSYQTTGHPDKIFRYAGPADGHILYRDDAGRLWYFENDTAYLYRSNGYNPNVKPAETGVDTSRSNTMWADGRSTTVYVGQYWQAPTWVSWCPDGMHLIGWDYAEGTGYVRWKPGAYIKNTGNDLSLYPIYGY